MVRLYKTDEKTGEAIRKGCLSFLLFVFDLASLKSKIRHGQCRAFVQICFPQKTKKMDYYSTPTKGKTAVISLIDV